ncbi:MAG: phosphoglucosamine mutase, partial [Planctomycetes bacterium]|nr:phosphoglucosamine mutase [Planctomycetota bacterium]
MSRERLFGTDGIRGTAGEGALAPERVLAAGRALARVLGPRARRAVLVRDTRRSGPLVRDALSAGLLAEGVDVIDAGVRPTPALPYLLLAWGCDFGAVLSASHNPMPDNGVKIFGPDGQKLSDEIEDRIEAEAARSAPPRTGKAIGRALPVPAGKDPYRAALLAEGRRAGGLEGLRLVADCAHGAAYQDAPAILRALGAEVFELGTAPDGDNINEDAGALRPEGMAAETVRRRAFAGLALDGDGDRLVLADEAGAVRDGDFVLAALARRLHARGELPGGAVAGTVMSNVGLEVSLRGIGARLHRAPVGDRYVAEAMREHGWALGGEPSGHVIFRGPRGLLPGDGLLTALRVFEAAREAG